MSDGQMRRVLLGRIVGAQGLRGEVVIHSFTGEADAIGSYGPLADARGGRMFELQVVRVAEKGVIARVKGVSDRTAAEALKGVELWVERDRLPPPEEGEFYHTDLVGLAAVAPDGEAIGEVIAVQNYGASDLLEIRLAGTRKTEFVPFTDAFVPEVDLEARRCMVRMPGASADDKDEGDDRGPDA
ncbi:MAG: ribosome maturation factor RimM [Proteobacteria bacterium]|nr:ribosome maturation factor RimM [Pseudomonadota bacterium]